MVKPNLGIRKYKNTNKTKNLLHLDANFTRLQIGVSEYHA